jgi:hypothetical protein
MNGVGRARGGARAKRQQPTILDSLSDNSEAEDDWEPMGADAGSRLDDDGLSDGGFDASQDQAQAQSLLSGLSQ